MKKNAKPLATLADLEREVVAEYRELGRRQLEVHLQQLADQTARFPPLRQGKRRNLTLRTELGLVKLTVDYGQYPTTPQWFCPQQRAWGLAPHQKITPGLAEKLCFTAVATTSYAQAAAVATRWGVAVDDAVIHQQVQRAGARAEQQAQVRITASATLAAAPPNRRCRRTRGAAAWAKLRASMWWPLAACGFGTSWPIVLRPPRWLLR